ncbi:MAG: Hpt domain-containing protein [Candidatus Omnitrophica bacterium]|nr:Hpt domain-containing protein [Candidatus Omnitrophota bacterium]
MTDPKNSLEVASEKFCKEMGLGKEVFFKLLATAIADMQKDIDLLRAALDAGDLERIQQISHRIKGTSSNFRLTEITVPATELNDSSKKGADASLYKSFLHSIESSFAAYQQGLADSR